MSGARVEQRLSGPGLLALGLLVLGLLLVAHLACSRRGEEVRATAEHGAVQEGPAGRQAFAPEPDDKFAHEHDHGHDQGHETHVHEHGEVKEPSDLDLPAGELLAHTCEHGVKTHTCAGCRYEVGMVELDPVLAEQGLVRLSRVERRVLEQALELTGEVRLDERAVAHLAPPLPGVVRRVMVQVGSRIEGGTPLLELDCPELREAQAAHMEASSALGLARASFERQEALQRSQAIPEREYQEARQAREAAELRLQAARDRLTLLGAPAAAAGGAEQAGTALGRLVLRSPLAGTVLALHTVAGETAAAEERLIVVADPQRLWVQADLYEQDLAMLLAEQQAHGSRLPASLEVRAYPLRTFPATLEMVGALLDPETRTVKLRLSVEGHDGLLRPGMYAQVRLPLGGGEPVLAVPESAVLEDEGRFFVFRREQDRYFLRRPVEPGRVRAGWVEIRAGLDGRETVVADGAFLLKSEVLRAKMGAGCAD